MNVFSFLADFLREDEINTKMVGADLKGEAHPKMSETPKQMLMEAPLIKNDMAHIKNLMDRVDAKSVDQAYTNNLLATQRKEFEQEIKKLKEKISEDLKTEKLNDEGIVVSGNTVNVITENGVEKVIVANERLNATFERKVEN